MSSQNLPTGPTSLCFNKEDFMKANFNVESFILDCRRRVSLDTVQEDLKLYLKVLQSSMIELLNKDYADFVNLSSNLVGLDKAINNIMHPLGQFGHEVELVKNTLDTTIKEVEEKLKKRVEIHLERALLLRLRSIIHSVEKMERLLNIHHTAAEPNVQYPSELSGPLIERVASQFNKLQFHVNKSRGLPLVENIKPRIASITSTLQYSLEGSFKEGLETNDSEMLRQCLRTYAIIDKMRDAENLFRQCTVKVYMEMVIDEAIVTSSPDGLKKMYDTVLDFIPKHCQILKDVTSGNIPGGGEVVRGYDFMVNAVWPEIVSNIEARVPSVFAPGNPVIFHERYTTSIGFLESFERLCGSQASVKRLRTHPSYNLFMSKWSLPVYFQIRFQEIAGTLESALELPLDQYRAGAGDFHLQPTAMTWSSIHRCWQPDVYLPSLCHRFWKLTLQILSRYAGWVTSTASAVMEKAAEGSTKSDQSVQSVTTGQLHHVRTGSTDLQKAQQQQQRDIDNIVLLVTDCQILSNKLPEFLANVVQPELTDYGTNQTTFDLLQGGISDAQSTLLRDQERLGNFVITAVATDCKLHLRSVSDLPRLYRRTNREVPSQASAYVQLMVKPIQSFLESHMAILTSSDQANWTAQMLSSIAEVYLTNTTDVLTSVKKMEESLKRLKKGKAATSATEGLKGMSDDDKIRLQLYLDVLEFGEQITKLGTAKESVKSYQLLLDVVTAAKDGSQ